MWKYENQAFYHFFFRIPHSDFHIPARWRKF